MAWPTRAAFLSLAVLVAACAERAPEDGEEQGTPSIGEATNGDEDATALVARYAAPIEGDPGSVDLYEDLGAYHREITTSSPEAADYFDQGLRLQYAFNHAEAIRAYEEALRYDPECAMCWWGIALASGNNINAPMDPESGRRAYAAAQRALELAGDVSPGERALIEALAQRYGPDPEARRAALDSAYARAMGAVASAHPEDGDVLTLSAAAAMNLSPWAYWDGKEPRPGTDEILGWLTRALELDPDNPGACHYYIHSVEAAYPERAVECADRLAALMPGAGHLVHMPGHIYIRVGRYGDAVRANEHAVHADEGYIQDQRPAGLYPSAYYPHNYHFMWFAATMAGMSEKAIRAAVTVAPKVPHEVAQQLHWIQTVVVLPQLAQVTFGLWEDALQAPMPAPDLLTATTMAHYARGIALAATARASEAAAELDAIDRLMAEHEIADDDQTTNAVIAIARHALAGELALRTGDAAGAVGHFRAGAKIEDGMIYEEPPLWYRPLRHSLGRALLEAGLPAEAEEAYLQDLERFPDNGWSLFGLFQALKAQGKTAAAGQAEARFRMAWSEADVELTASSF
jgi:tetratricopeptide (TPR) repeat protein